MMAPDASGIGAGATSPWRDDPTPCARKSESLATVINPTGRVSTLKNPSAYPGLQQRTFLPRPYFFASGLWTRCLAVLVMRRGQRISTKGRLAH